MPELIARPALGHTPVTHGAASLAEAPWMPISSVAPFPKGATALTKALKPLGLSFPKAGEWVEVRTDSGLARIAWAGRDLAFLMGVPAPDGLADVAAVTDQSDAWVRLALAGAGATDVLARLCPLDLRGVARGQSFRTGLNHLPLMLMAEGGGAFTLLTFRSMARTAWHELTEAMERVAARAG